MTDLEQEKNPMRRGRRALTFCLIGLTALLCADYFRLRENINVNGLSWDNLPGFYAIVGFFSCCALVIIAKIVVGTLLSRSDNYYDV